MIVKLDDIEKHARHVVEAIVGDTRTKLHAQLQFISQEQDEEGQFESAFAESRVAKFVGSVVPMQEERHGASSHVAVFFDVKLSGEANSRPALRIAPLRHELYEKRLKMVMTRHQTGQTEDEDEDESTPPPGDVYFLFDGGKPGNAKDYLKPFWGKPLQEKTWLLHIAEESVQARMGKVGVATIKLAENFDGHQWSQLGRQGACFPTLPGVLSRQPGQAHLPAAL